MTTLTATIQGEAGLHARPASAVVKKAGEFGVAITLECNGKTADAKRLLAVLALGAKKGDTVTVSSEDDAAAEAVKALIESH
ncbi:MAG: HPr family phosphocarrier protein [Cellulosilyticaceae bacterium]